MPACIQRDTPYHPLAVTQDPLSGGTARSCPPARAGCLSGWRCLLAMSLLYLGHQAAPLARSRPCRLRGGIPAFYSRHLRQPTGDGCPYPGPILSSSTRLCRGSSPGSSPRLSSRRWPRARGWPADASLTQPPTLPLSRFALPPRTGLSLEAAALAIRLRDRETCGDESLSMAHSLRPHPYFGSMSRVCSTQPEFAGPGALRHSRRRPGEEAASGNASAGADCRTCFNHLTMRVRHAHPAAQRPGGLRSPTCWPPLQPCAAAAGPAAGLRSSWHATTPLFDLVRPVHRASPEQHLAPAGRPCSAASSPADRSRGALVRATRRLGCVPAGRPVPRPCARGARPLTPQAASFAHPGQRGARGSLLAILRADRTPPAFNPLQSERAWRHACDRRRRPSLLQAVTCRGHCVSAALRQVAAVCRQCRARATCSSTPCVRRGQGAFARWPDGVTRPLPAPSPSTQPERSRQGAVGPAASLAIAVAKQPRRQQPNPWPLRSRRATARKSFEPRSRIEALAAVQPQSALGRGPLHLRCSAPSARPSSAL